MPKKSKYGRLDGSLSFSDIAEIISEHTGERITAMTARSVVMNVLEKIVRKVSAQHGRPISYKKAQQIVKNHDFQNNIVGLITEVYNT